MPNELVRVTVESVPGTGSRVEVWRGGSVSSTGLRFHTPLIKLDGRRVGGQRGTAYAGVRLLAPKQA